MTLVFAASFEAGNVGFKANFRFTNKHKSDVDRQLLLAIQRAQTLESLYEASDRADGRATKRPRHSYLNSVEPVTRTNPDGTVDMLLTIVVAEKTYYRFNVMWSANLNKHVIYVRDGLELLRTNSVRRMFVNISLTHNKCTLTMS